jgi:hypothetical protein
MHYNSLAGQRRWQMELSTSSRPASTWRWDLVACLVVGHQGDARRARLDQGNGVVLELAAASGATG